MRSSFFVEKKPKIDIYGMDACSHYTKIHTEKRHQIDEKRKYRYFYIIRHFRAEARFDDASEVEFFFEFPVKSL
jgi:hypothetical protein